MIIAIGVLLRNATERKKPGLRTPLLRGARSEWLPDRPLCGGTSFRDVNGELSHVFEGAPFESENVGDFLTLSPLSTIILECSDSDS